MTSCWWPASITALVEATALGDESCFRGTVLVVLYPPPPSAPILTPRGCVGSVVWVEVGGVRLTHQASMIKSQDPVTMSVSFYNAHTFQLLWSGRVWTLSTCLGQRREGGWGIPPVIPHWWMGDITALGDRCHWRLKAPTSGLERMEVERDEGKERETVAAERVNTNAAGKADMKWVVRWRERRGLFR